MPVRSTFEEEADKTFENLKPYMPFDMVYSSPLTRAKKLAEFCGYTNPIITVFQKKNNSFLKQTSNDYKNVLF